ncbi:MAG: DoxX family membrane protein [Phycisphaerales bacterium]|nr:DoxX family membrane protein [Phycisphaerales bacterium]
MTPPQTSTSIPTPISNPTGMVSREREGALPAARPLSSRTAEWLLRHFPRLVVAALFVLAAVMKIQKPAEFAKDIQNYGLVPVDATHLLAMFIPWFELTTALLLFAGRWSAPARLWIVIMLVGFNIAKLTLVARGLPLECGCFGKGNWLSDFLNVLNKGQRGIWFNFALIALLAVDVLLTRRRGPAAAAQPAA